MAKGEGAKDNNKECGRGKVVFFTCVSIDKFRGTDSCTEKKRDIS